MIDDDGEIGKEMEINKTSCFEVKSKKATKGIDEADVLPDDVEITLPDGTGIHN